MDSNRKITKKFTKKFDSIVINRQYFHRRLKGEAMISWRMILMQQLKGDEFSDNALSNAVAQFLLILPAKQ